MGEGVDLSEPLTMLIVLASVPIVAVIFGIIVGVWRNGGLRGTLLDIMVAVIGAGIGFYVFAEQKLYVKGVDTDRDFPFVAGEINVLAGALIALALVGLLRQIQSA